MINFEWYRTFKAIYQTGTLTGASQELLISQPNVSQHLSALEHYMGKQLFERKPRKMVPTEYGNLFYTQIIGAVEKLEDVETDFRQAVLTKQHAITCIGAPREYFNKVLAPKLHEVNLQMAVKFGVTKELMTKLSKGELKFVFATHKMEEKDIAYEPTLFEHFHLVGSPGLDTTELKRYITRKEMDKAEHWLCTQNWFAYSSDLMIIRRFWLKNFKKRPTIKPRFIIPDFESIISAIYHGNGVTIASDYLVKDMLKKKELKELWKGNTPTTNTIYLAYNKNSTTTSEVQLIKSLLK